MFTNPSENTMKMPRLDYIIVHEVSKLKPLMLPDFIAET